MQKDWHERVALSIWVQSNRHVNKLKQFGKLEYVSKKMHYVVLYIDLEKKEEILKQINKLHFVKKIEESHRPEISMNFQESLAAYGETIEENAISRLMATK